MKKIVVAIDGYSSCGKSTLAKALAKRFNYAYVDTGAMYRAVTLYFLRHQLSAVALDETAINTHLDQIQIDFRHNAEKGQSDTYLNGENVEEIIRGKEVSNAVSEVSQIKSIRQRMVSLQQQIGKQKGVVMDGRDIGTAVFPDAELKLFMTADPLIRAQRRYQELLNKGQELSLEEVKANLAKRDYNDTHRIENPLRQADDAIVIDNSNLTEEEQLEEAAGWVEKALS